MSSPPAEDAKPGSDSVRERIEGGPLAGRRTVVTGTGAALERALAQRLRQDGARVVVQAHSQPSDEAVRRSEVDQRSAAADQVRHELGGVDLVVAVVPAETGGAFAAFEASTWTTAVERRLSSTIVVARTYLDDLVVAAGNGSADLVLVGSAAAHELARAFAVPTATAAALAQLARALRVELAEDGVRVHHVAPGLLVGPGGGEGPGAEDVAAVVAFIAALPAGTNLAEVSLLPTHPA